MLTQSITELVARESATLERAMFVKRVHARGGRLRTDLDKSQIKNA